MVSERQRGLKEEALACLEFLQTTEEVSLLALRHRAHSIPASASLLGDPLDWQASNLTELQSTKSHHLEKGTDLEEWYEDSSGWQHQLEHFCQQGFQYMVFGREDLCEPLDMTLAIPYQLGTLDAAAAAAGAAAHEAHGQTCHYLWLKCEVQDHEFHNDCCLEAWTANDLADHAPDL